VKKIIHFKVPLLNRGMMDDLAIRPETLRKFLELIKGHLGEEFIVTASPFDPSELRIDNEELRVLNFDMKQISVEDLINLIKL